DEPRRPGENARESIDEQYRDYLDGPSVRCPAWDTLEEVVQWLVGRVGVYRSLDRGGGKREGGFGTRLAALAQTAPAPPDGHQAAGAESRSSAEGRRSHLMGHNEQLAATVCYLDCRTRVGEVLRRAAAPLPTRACEALGRAFEVAFRDECVQARSLPPRASP